jgi:ribonuclease T2
VREVYMRRYTSVAVALVLLLAGSGSCLAKKKKGGAATFDYYVLTLSWSPQHCATTPKDRSPQCAGPRMYGFVVHGLWPNANSGRHPYACAGPAFDRSFATADLVDVMPSLELVRHEWEKHGTCSGLTPHDYFRRVLDAYQMVTIPREVRTPDRRVETTPAALRDEFAAANPTFGTEAFEVMADGRFLREVRVCFDRELKPLACRERGDTSERPIILRPSR